MISGKQYIETAKKIFSFLETEFGFRKEKETINGSAFYDLEYRNTDKAISISYENMEDHLEVIVFILENGNLSHYDDKTKTLHLKDLNKSIISKRNPDDIKLNSNYFTDYKVESVIDKKLLKEAKELRLCLKYI